jgi:hypothetical protein
MDRKMILAAAGVVAVTAGAVNAQVAAYWRFEDGPDQSDVPHLAGTGQFSQDILDVSGNGNHLSTWRTGDCCGYQYRSDVESVVIPGTDEANNYSVKNTGCCPGMFTDSSISLPAGVDIDTMTPRAWTVEASFKPEWGGYRTIVGRDAADVVAGNGALAALYLQVRPGNEMVCAFADVSGQFHEAISVTGLIQGFDWPSDHDGLTGTWYHVAAVSDGATLSLWVNGSLVGTADLSGSPDPSLAVGTASGGDWHAGGWSVGRGLFNRGHTDRGYGFIDEVRISVGALTPDQFLFPAYNCPPDFNGDGFLDFFDYSDYVGCFETGNCIAGHDADFNHDDFVDFFDYIDFVAAFESGC